MELLTILTLIYVAVLILVLAASLIAILVYLRRINDALKDTYSALETVREETEPLHEPLETLNVITEDAAEAFGTARQNLSEADERLAALMEPEKAPQVDR